MNNGTEQKCLDILERKWIRDEDARKLIINTCGVSSGTQLQQWDRKDRDTAMRKLKALGISVRQLERLTGINRGVIQKA